MKGERLRRFQNLIELGKPQDQGQCSPVLRGLEIRAYRLERGIAVALAFALASHVGCSASEPARADVSPATPVSADSQPPEGDAGQEDAGPTGKGRLSGSVIFFQNGNSIALYASFERLFGTGRRCPSKSIGTCSIVNVRQCTGDPFRIEKVSGGTVTVVSDDPLSRGYPPKAELVTLPPREEGLAKNGYFDVQKVLVTASGDALGVPAFSAKVDVAPHGMTIHKPLFDNAILDGSKALDIPQNEPLHLEWQPLSTATRGVFNVSLIGFSAANPPPVDPPGTSGKFDPDVYMNCAYEASAGAAELPTAALAEFGPGAANIRLSLDVDTVVPQHEYISLSSISEVVRPDGRAISTKGATNAFVR